MSFNFVFSNVDVNKASAGLAHDFITEVEFTDEDGVTQKAPVTIKCRYFKAGEYLGCATLSADSGMRFDFRKIFKTQVDEISGISFNGIPVTKEMILEGRSNIISEQIINNVAGHLLGQNNLNPDEVKN